MERHGGSFIQQSLSIVTGTTNSLVDKGYITEYARVIGACRDSYGRTNSTYSKITDLSPRNQIHGHLPA